MKPSEYLEKFETALRVEFDSEATIKNYLSAVKQFFGYVGSIKQSDLTPKELLENYMAWHFGSKAEPKTVNLHRSAIVKFFYRVKNIKISTSDVPRRKEHKKLPRIVQQEKIQEAIRRTLNIKHRLELMLFFDCGIRLCEMAGLKRKNIMTDNGVLWLCDTKGNKQRIVPISESVKPLLYEYIFGMEPEQLVFGGVSKKCFENVVHQAFARVGEHATPHMLRHSFATYLISEGENPFKVQSWLGHGSIKTTGIYVHLSNAILSKKKDLINRNYTNKSVV